MQVQKTEKLPRRRIAKIEGPDPVDVHVGNRIRLRRTLMNLSQGQLAAAVGVTFQQVQKYERGSNRVSASRLYDIARVLGVSITFFFEDLDDAAKDRPSNGLMSGDPAPNYEMDDLSRSETLEVVRAYWRLPSSTMRDQVRELLSSMAGGR